MRSMLGLPPIQLCYSGVASICVEDANEVEYNHLQNPKLELVKNVWHQHFEAVKAKRNQARERILLYVGEHDLEGTRNG
jgi:hypothetical protein